MIIALQVVLLGTVGFMLLYLAFLSLMAFKERNYRQVDAKKKRRFAVVVPAYNEEESIGHTLEGLFDVKYDPSQYEVFVIADNCTDRTAEVAGKMGATVMVRNNPEERGKGYALRWCFDQLVEENEVNRFDGVVVVDADTKIKDNLLEVMNKYMEQGAEVVQGYLTVDSKPGVWTSEIIRIGFTLYDFVRPMGRKAIGCPAGLRGNGMCFSMEVLEQVPWSAYTLTEDLEYGIQLLLNEVDVTFAPETVGYNVVPENAKNAESQRERWEMGRFPVLREYTGPLLREALKRRSFKIFDTLIDLVTLPLVNMMLFVMLMIALSFLLWMTGVQQSLLFTALWLFVFGLGVFHALVGLCAAGVGTSTYKSLLYVPKYALWKIYIYFKVLVVKGRATEWVRTSRESK